VTEEVARLRELLGALGVLAAEEHHHQDAEDSKKFTKKNRGTSQKTTGASRKARPRIVSLVRPP